MGARERVSGRGLRGKKGLTIKVGILDQLERVFVGIPLPHPLLVLRLLLHLELVRDAFQEQHPEDELLVFRGVHLAA